MAFQPNHTGLAKLRQALRAGGAEAHAAAVKLLRMMIEEWKTAIVRVVPVEFGRLRASFQTRLEQEKGRVTGVVGTNVEEGIYTEMGTERIAGGAVKAWRLGDPVITDWAAKRKTAAAREQMPYLRPTGAALKPKLLQMLGKAASAAMAKHLRGRKF